MADAHLELKDLATCLEEQKVILAWLRNAMERITQEAEEDRRLIMEQVMQTPLAADRVDQIQAMLLSFSLSSPLLG